jgi:hypothetical protein
MPLSGVPGKFFDRAKIESGPERGKSQAGPTNSFFVAI